MFNKGLVHNLKRLRHNWLPTISLIGWVIRLYAGAVLSARFDFGYVHSCLKSDCDYKEIPLSNESLRTLLYIDKPFNENEVFHPKIGLKIQRIKAKSDVISASDTLADIILRGTITILDVKHTNQLPAHLQTTENILALTYVFPWSLARNIEKKYYIELDAVKSFIHFDLPPEQPIDATSVSADIVDYILSNAKRSSQWLDFDSLSEEKKVELLRTSMLFESDDPRFTPTIQEGILKYPMDYVWRMAHVLPATLREIVGLCNKHATQFNLGRTTEESNGIVVLLKYGLNPDLVSQEELGISKLNNFSVDHVNLEVMASAKDADQWSKHIKRMSKSFSAEDWLDLEQFIVKNPRKGHLVRPENQTAAMVISRFSQKNIEDYYFNLDFVGFREAVPFLVREKPRLIPKVIQNNSEEENLKNAFLAEIEKMPELPAFVAELSTPELLHRACAKSCLYSRTKLKSIDITEALACANTRQQFEFINRYLAPATVERHVELYPTSMHDDLLMSDLGL